MLLQRQSVCRSHGWVKSKCAGGRSRSSATMTTICTRRKLKPPLVCACSSSLTRTHAHCRSSHCACPCSEDEPDKKWNEMPGLRWNTPVEKTQYKVTYAECKDQCTEGALHSAVILLTHCLHRGRSVQVCDVQGEYSVMRPQQRAVATKPGC